MTIGSCRRAIHPAKLGSNNRESFPDRSLVGPTIVADFITSVLQLEKRCIFCGNPPSDKNKEHIIPQWLIDLTGDPKREWYLGLKFTEPGKPPRTFSANQFHFPSCEACNSRYSALEGRTKGYFLKLWDNQNLTAAEWDDLLDWFDKVRIGLFIGNMILNKDLPIPNPKFFIDQRVGTKDRCVMVYPIPDHDGLRVFGAGDAVFFHLPTSFMLLAKNLLFLNISSDFLLAPRMGFPFPRIFENAEDRTKAGDLTATFRPKIPFIRFSFYAPMIAVYQTILMKDFLDDETFGALAANDFVRSNLWTAGSAKAKLAIVNHGKLAFLGTDQTVPHSKLAKGQIKDLDQYCIRFFEYRKYVLEDALSSGRVSRGSRKLVRLMVKFNGYALNQIRSDGARVSLP
ncbi:hypothetical protein [Bradyrhizobium sp. 930_D9_N1_4]|uniref:hypothetical protein n=1 Tax=Bradyrhizobium sp. 930_D9_N1_4 TaxID=3240374 RepID=UPI003F895EA3